MVTQPDDLNSEYLERRNVLEAICKTEAGLYLLRMLVRATGWNKSIMEMGDAYRRDVWLYLRRYIPVEALPSVELYDLAQEQEQVRKLVQETEFLRELYNTTEQKGE